MEIELFLKGQRFFHIGAKWEYYLIVDGVVTSNLPFLECRKGLLHWLYESVHMNYYKGLPGGREKSVKT